MVPIFETWVLWKQVGERYVPEEITIELGQELEWEHDGLIPGEKLDYS